MEDRKRSGKGKEGRVEDGGRKRATSDEPFDGVAIENHAIRDRIMIRIASDEERSLNDLVDSAAMHGLLGHSAPWHFTSEAPLKVTAAETDPRPITAGYAASNGFQEYDPPDMALATESGKTNGNRP
ncbi:hypothetical protein B0H17DRAFT_1181200 [Mycena rosella]|uniref:Uncharacterized protein n=1 Tax=Mycena rosella TaxID=1033263 RepID=A0AAD7DCY0_MYCRO|nr:hypothetical protein B0H17DRAFT_1181200 [Mycena rosella]